MRLAATAILSALTLTTALPAQAQDAGDWIWRVGVHNVWPKSDNHNLINVDAAASLTFNATYMFAPHWAAEILETDAKVNGVRIGNVAIDPLAFGLSIGRRF